MTFAGKNKTLTIIGFFVYISITNTFQNLSTKFEQISSVIGIYCSDNVSRKGIKGFHICFFL